MFRFLFIVQYVRGVDLGRSEGVCIPAVIFIRLSLYCCNVELLLLVVLLSVCRSTVGSAKVVREVEVNGGRAHGTILIVGFVLLFFYE